MQNKSPLVSIITPSLNQGKYIEETIISVLNQSYSRIEYIIMDGGSTDATPDIVAKYLKDPRLIWISEKDAGQYDAVNKGFARAHGDIIGWINADDIYTSDAVARIVEVFQTGDGIDVVYGRLYRFKGNVKQLSIMFSRDFSYTWLKRYCYTNPSATFIRSNVISKDGFILDVSIPTFGDWDWFLRMAKDKKRFVFLPQYITFFRTHSQSRIMRMDRREIRRERIMLSSGHGIPFHYMNLWIDFIIPWIERIQNIIVLIKNGKYKEIVQRSLLNFRQAIRDIIEVITGRGQ